MSTPNTPKNGTIKNPAEWTTGDEPMTRSAQDSYLHTLARKAGERIADDMTKAEASIKMRTAAKDRRRKVDAEAESF